MKYLASKSPVSRRAFCRMMAGLGGLTAFCPFLAACTPADQRTPTGIFTPSAKPVSTLSPKPIQGLSPATSPSPVVTQGSSPATSPSPVTTQGLSPTISPSPVPTQESGIARVAFVKTRDRVEGFRRALDLLSLNRVRGKNVLLKPNFNTADPPPGSTDGALLRAMIEKLLEMGAGAITVADRSGMADTRSVMEEKGVFALAQELGFQVLVLDELGREGWVIVQPPGSHWERGFPFARPCLEAEALVQTCCLKTHRFGGHFTLSLKNSVGMVAKLVPGDNYDYMRELHSSLDQRLMIAEVNVTYTPALVVLDGVEAFVTGGPESGKRVWAEVMLAGTDRVALDAVGVAVLRHLGTTSVVSERAIFQQEQIARAVELGLGVDEPEKIQIVTGDLESETYATQIREILKSG